MPRDDEQVRDEIERAETLLSDLGPGNEPVAGAHAIEAVQAVVGLYGECLARMVERAGPDLVREFARDELVSHLLLVHDLHPVGVEDRIGEALAEVRTAFGAESLRLLDVQAGVAVLEVAVRGCQSTAAQLRGSAREVVLAAAPELDDVEIRAVAPEPSTVIPVEDLFPVGER
ncbi:nitrogen fixation protein NifU [Saccharopolyspora sp. WRP15-2]|uniref:Nitrogen fixation protein NifU n=1 Tax=Saccharopolyspora oryzae TaxID=2997343 RepID=A0ABT4UVH8_9PSEU|nr:nitrogen fixation protein NifU [Saccharopolyspora oryzae]MDA3625216.1 nitrogen fixation protein NifU [Saccharopolyspora oryzae]